MKKYLKKNWFERVFLQAENVFFLESHSDIMHNVRDTSERIIDGRTFVRERGHYSVLP